ncbi:MAG: glycosyltransferase family 4 protein [Halothiobacillus sp.]|jgi:glycosyltransferase involved in cell wall biosynthesis|nr:glycosyltransferase family 4 protein [Halothiobacillus sp.]
MTEISVRVLHVVGSIDVGGAEQHVLDLCRIQQAQGFAVRVALPVRGALSEVLDQYGIEYEFFGRGGRWSPLALWRLWRVIHRDPLNLIHAHMPRSASMVKKTKGGIPFVVTAHNIVKSVRPFVGANFVICVSNQVKESLLTLGFRSERVAVVHNAIVPLNLNPDVREHVRDEMGWDRSVVILCVARLVLAKGQSYAIRALPAILAIEPAVKLVLLGAGPDELKLRALASNLGVAEQVVFLGARRDVPQLLQAADIYLQPSIKEGFCISFLEAMSVGLPCVGTRTGAIPEMLQRGEEGILIEPADTRAIEVSVNNLIRNPMIAVRYAHQAKIFVDEAFGQERQLRETLVVYRRVIASAHNF